MASSEIVTRIKKVFPDFKAQSVCQFYADEVVLKVESRDFKDTCLILHKILPSPVMMLFACDESKERGSFVINCVFVDFKNSQWIIVSMDIAQENPSFDTLAKSIHSASLFEREIWEMFGIESKENPDLRRLRLHDEVWPKGNYPLRKCFQTTQGENLSDYKFARVEGEGIFEVPVGPVHAGIIGPGHFRFSVAGEPIINLELRFGFTHRGVEKLFEDKLYTDVVGLSECVSGDSSFAHSLAFTQASEKISGVTVPAQASILRAIFLELERMHNHVNDIGGIAVDVGFSFPHAYASIIKEAILQLNEKLSGNRYLRKVNVVGGVTQDMDETKKRLLLDSLKSIKYDFNELVRILNSSVSFMDRVDATGVLRRKTAEDLGVVGLVARASGIPTDLRKYFPGVYNQAKFKMMTQESGDVLARLRVRISEFEESIRLIEVFVSKLAKLGELKVIPGTKGGSALGYTEGWRGPVLYWLETNPAGLIERCKIVDPSFLNWQGLSYAVLGDIIPDFPLCNKSFNLSYSGNDL
ncbi:MAG: NADH-quinone oxidoreductase subunit C [Candidatus Omnitrophica bacterium]|jgi:Ni,Fe-hydrogenase III large subunit/Ni,Fe-hydrogenase III component G|nr:NADH-quinone oxidoreductase subunit C [Candidatus Omnitrophota bacterium]